MSYQKQNKYEAFFVVLSIVLVKFRRKICHAVEPFGESICSRGIYTNDIEITLYRSLISIDYIYISNPVLQSLVHRPVVLKRFGSNRPIAQRY